MKRELKDTVRRLDGQLERWLFVDGVRKPYICDTHDEFMHFCRRAAEHGDEPRAQYFRKAVA